MSAQGSFLIAAMLNLMKRLSYQDCGIITTREK